MWTSTEHEMQLIQKLYKMHHCGRPVVNNIHSPLLAVSFPCGHHKWMVCLVDIWLSNSIQQLCSVVLLVMRSEYFLWYYLRGTWGHFSEEDILHWCLTLFPCADISVDYPQWLTAYFTSFSMLTSLLVLLNASMSSKRVSSCSYVGSWEQQKIESQDCIRFLCLLEDSRWRISSSVWYIS